MSAPPPPEASRSAAAQARRGLAAGRHGSPGSARSAPLSRQQSRRGRVLGGVGAGRVGAKGVSDWIEGPAGYLVGLGEGHEDFRLDWGSPGNLVGFGGHRSLQSGLGVRGSGVGFGGRSGRRVAGICGLRARRL